MRREDPIGHNQASLVSVLTQGDGDRLIVIRMSQNIGAHLPKHPGEDGSLKASVVPVSPALVGHGVAGRGEVVGDGAHGLLKIQHDGSQSGGACMISVLVLVASEGSQHEAQLVKRVGAVDSIAANSC